MAPPKREPFPPEENDMVRNTYKGLLEDWKVRLIRQRARRRGFRGQDLEDAVQQAALAVLGFRYDEAKSNGAAESTVLTAIVDHQLFSLYRSQTRRAHHLEQYATGASEEYEVTPGLELSLDVQQVVDSLPPLARQVCLRLWAGASAAAVARELGTSWHTVQRQAAIIQQRFEAAGLGRAGCQAAV
jgi:DNA-directed RNA polymerase specialized sigma24 family protein